MIINITAQHYGLPLPPPSKEARDGGNMQSGINFAVVGSRAMDAKFYEKRGIYDTVTNVSMWDQLDWFKQMLPYLCHNPSGECHSVILFPTPFVNFFFFGFFVPYTVSILGSY